MAGAAGMSSPHQKASTGTWFCRPPKVMNTVVAFCELTFTPFGSRRIAADAPELKRTEKARIPMMRFVFMLSSENAQVDAGCEGPAFVARPGVEDAVEHAGVARAVA